MDFNIEITDFPSVVHKNIYFGARGITPLEQSLTFTTDPDLRTSCIEFYHFLMDMLSDMYNNPERYYLPVRMLENYCNGQKVNGLKQKYPSKTKNILAQTGSVVHGYLVLLYSLVQFGELKNNILTVSNDNLSIIHKRVSSSLSPISLDQRLDALKNIGLSNNNGEFISLHYPNMFRAMNALAKKAEKLSGFDFFAFCNLEFRNLNSKYTPTYEDYFKPLYSSLRKHANTLHVYAVENRMIPSINTYWKVDYKYKGVKVMFLASHDCNLVVGIIGTYASDDPNLINDRLAKESPEFQTLALRNLWRCNACATTHLGSMITVLGKKQRVCYGGQIAFKWRNPSDSDLEHIKKLIQFRLEIIDELKKKK